MAINDDRRKADGWLNVAIVDAQGNEHKFPKGIPLYESTKLGRSILNKMEADADYAPKLVGSVVVTTGEIEDIDL